MRYFMVRDGHVAMVAVLPQNLADEEAIAVGRAGFAAAAATDRLDGLKSGPMTIDGPSVGWGTTDDNSGPGVSEGYNSSNPTDFFVFPNNRDGGEEAFQMEVASAPEPSTWAMMLIGSRASATRDGVRSEREQHSRPSHSDKRGRPESRPCAGRRESRSGR
jgi:hypothetical protein